MTLQGGGQRGVVADGPVPGEQRGGLEIGHHARVAFLAVLVSPIGVVLVVVGYPVHLVGHGTLRGALRGVAPSGEGEGVVACNLLDTEVVGERVVEGAFHIALLGPSVTDAGGERPTAGAHAAAVGVHAAQQVVAVGHCGGHLMAGGHVGGAEVVVVAACHRRHGEIVVLEGQRGVVVAREVVQAADVGKAELTRLHVIHGRPVDEHLVVTLVEGTVTMACRRE